MSNFLRYSGYYDLLYGDKDYAGEADYVARRLREVAPATRSVLELGSGTGRHGRLLAGLGFDIHGVEQSADMVALARRSGAAGPGSFDCEVGDLRAVRLGRSFDAVIALFHVISYQTGNDDLLAAFGTAVAHLPEGGVFLFDVWHGPAVLTERPSRRTKQAADAARRVRRLADPRLDTEAAVVTVRFDLECEDLASGHVERFSEDHRMRYLFPTEIDLLARATGFAVLRSEEFLTGAPPSERSWGVAYMLRKRA